MANYTSGPSYATGYDDGSETWNNPDTHARINGIISPEPQQSWLRFSGAGAVLAGSAVASATLSGVPQTPYPTLGGVTIEVYGERADDAALPSNLTDANGRSMTTATASSASGVADSPWNIDVTSIIQELQANHGGDVIMLRLRDSASNGETLISTATLSIEYTPTGGGGPSVDPASGTQALLFVLGGGST